MLWTIFLVAVVKYMWLIIKAHDHGEGGTFALYAVLTRALRLKFSDADKFERTQTILAVVALIGVACVLADSVLTPAISILGAVQGLSVIITDMPQTDDVVVGLTCVILFLLFQVQRFGTARVSVIFSPIMFLWFLSLALIGFYNITGYPGVVAAVFPSYAIQFFINNGYSGFATLGAVFLTVTGTEAMYADLGHFSPFAMRFAASLVVPCLMLCYTGQAAAIILDPTHTVTQNVFYRSLPEALVTPVFVLATCAAVIASQAMISASFSLVAQAMKLQLMPPMTIVHTSSLERGQVYVPQMNWFFFGATLFVVIAFRNATALGYAYGIAVSSVFCITTGLYALILVFHFHRHWVLAVGFVLVFGTVDVAFLGANLLKVPSGGWLTVVCATLMSLVLCIWRWGRLRMVNRQRQMTIPDEELFMVRGVPLTTRLPGSFIVCYSSTMGSVPAAYAHFSRRCAFRPDVLVFVTINVVNQAYVDSTVVLVPFPGMGGDSPGVWRAMVNHGYFQKSPTADDVTVAVIKALKPFLSAGIIPQDFDWDLATASQIITVADPTFVVGHDMVVPNKKGCMHTMLVSVFQAMLTWSRSIVDDLRIDQERMLTVGVTVAI